MHRALAYPHMMCSPDMLETHHYSPEVAHPPPLVFSSLTNHETPMILVVSSIVLHIHKFINIPSKCTTTAQTCSQASREMNNA